MVQTAEFYLVPEDVYRLGNAAGPKLDNVRQSDVETNEINGVVMVVANGKGVSVFDRDGLARVPLAGWVWRIPARTPLPAGLKFVHDPLPDIPGHYVIAPVHNMPLAKYKGLLEELAVHAVKVGKHEVKQA
jgi:hypothetical protein